MRLGNSVCLLLLATKAEWNGISISSYGEIEKLLEGEVPQTVDVSDAIDMQLGLAKVS